MNNRTQKLLNILSEKDIQAAIIVNPSNRRYLSGFTGSSGVLYVSQQKQILLTDFRYIEQGNKQCLDYEIVNHQAKGINALINSYMKEDNVDKVAIESDTVSYSEFLAYKESFEGVNIEGTTNLVENLRKIKDKEEIDNIAKAESIGDMAFTHITGFIQDNYKKGVTEKEIALELERVMQEHGASGTSFDTIVASGAKSSLPHAVPEDVTLEDGDFVVMDYGCIYNGYCSDMTRTIVIGEPTNKHLEIYNTVLKANKEAIRGLKAGKTGKEIDAIARDIIVAKGYGDYFGHGLGHSVGLDIHEDPRLSPNDNSVLEPGVVITVEPGIYLAGFGGVRIEDLLVVTEDGHKNLTVSSKELVVIS